MFFNGGNTTVDGATTRQGMSGLTGRLAIALLAALSLFAFQLAHAQSSSAATGVLCPQTGNELVATDDSQYAPGSIVHVTGMGYAPNCDVVVKVTRPDGTVVKGDGSFMPGSDTVTTDLFGNLSYDYQLQGFPPIIGTYGVDVLGLADVVLAHSTFEDASTDLPLRSDFTTGIFHGTTNQTLSATAGTTPTTKPFSITGTGSATYDFYSPPLTTTGPALGTNDKGQVTVYLQNTGTGTFSVDVGGTFFDYNPATGTQTPIVVSAAGNCSVGTGSSKCMSGNTSLGAPYAVPAGHLLKVTITITRTSGSGTINGNLIYNGNNPSTTGNQSVASLPNTNSVTWPFGAATGGPM